MATNGVAFANPLSTQEDDRLLRLTTQLEESLRKAHALNKPTSPGIRRKGCPAAARTLNYDGERLSGVTLLARTMHPFLMREYTNSSTTSNT